jgi:hypothetical protein
MLEAQNLWEPQTKLGDTTIDTKAMIVTTNYGMFARSNARNLHPAIHSAANRQTPNGGVNRPMFRPALFRLTVNHAYRISRSREAKGDPI